MKTKMFAMLLALVILCTGFASAVNLQITDLEINGRTVQDTSSTAITRDYERGEELELYVCVEALTDVRDAQIYADISGYDYSNDEWDKVHDATDTFDLKANHRDCFDLSLEVPTKIDKDYFKLRIRADDRNGSTVFESYQLYLKGIDRRSSVEIKDFSLDPSEVIAGRAFTGKIKVHNLWDDTVEDLKVTMAVPELNIKVSEYMDEIDPDKSKTFEELLLRIPECAKAGDYDVVITVEFDEFRETQTMGSITVLKSETCGATTGSATEDRTTVTVPSMQELSQGTSIVYPVVLNNVGANAQTYTLSLSGVSSWGTTRIEPSAIVVVPAGQSRTAYVHVSANPNAEVGDKAFTLTIDAGSDSKSVPLIAKVTKSSGSDLSSFKNVVTGVLVGLVVILIIVGLVIGFNKMKDNKNETEPYY
ncbi:MAG TPA: hypothetical protein VEC16_03800 [Alphaproteobacteria bacterium]|nr:hypothetical protein [Alphaproteobacteria bacterium]